jgi:hypothetical protein
LPYSLLQNAPPSTSVINDQPKTEPTRVRVKRNTNSNNNPTPIEPPNPTGPYVPTQKDKDRRDRRTKFKNLNITHMKKFNTI